MATQLDFPSEVNVRVNGTLSARSFSPPSGSITNASVAASAGIEASKVIHRLALRYAQASGADVAAQTMLLHTFRNTATIEAVEVIPSTAPTGGDKAFTVDVQLGDASTAFATILSGVVTVNSSSANRTIQTGSLSTSSAADGDTLQVVVAASGSTGSQGQGLLVVVWVSEEP